MGEQQDEDAKKAMRALDVAASAKEKMLRTAEDLRRLLIPAREGLPGFDAHAAAVEELEAVHLQACEAFVNAEAKVRTICALFDDPLVCSHCGLESCSEAGQVRKSAYRP